MTILSLDTCFEGCSAAALLGETTGVFSACESFRAVGQGHAEHLMTMIDEAMSGTGAPCASLARIGVTIGPGTFTGTRIGIAAARGLAVATRARLIGISSLQAIAWRALQDAAGSLEGGNLLVCMDARRDQVYCQLVSTDGLAQSEPELLTIADAAVGLAAQADASVGTGASAVAAARLDANLSPVRVLDGISFTNLAGSMLPRLGAWPLNDSAVRPLYLRPPDAKPQAPVLPGQVPVR